MAKAVSGFNFVEGFAVLCASHVSMASPFLGFYVLRTFQWLRRFWVSVCFARFNGFAVSRFAVSMPTAFDATLFQCLRRLTLTLFLLLRCGVPRHNNIETLCVAFLFKKSSIVNPKSKIKLYFCKKVFGYEDERRNSKRLATKIYGENVGKFR
jgi:hypothetical protein